MHMHRWNVTTVGYLLISPKYYHIYCPVKMCHFLLMWLHSGLHNCGIEARPAVQCLFLPTRLTQDLLNAQIHSTTFSPQPLLLLFIEFLSPLSSYLFHFQSFWSCSESILPVLTEQGHLKVLVTGFVRMHPTSKSNFSYIALLSAAHMKL